MKKIIVLVLVVAVLLSGCTFVFCKPAYVNAGTGEQVWSCVTRQKGAALPVITIYDPYRTYTKR